MAWAKKNPNDRRRLNLISRWAHKTGTPAHEAVALWLSEKNLPAPQRSISRTAMYGPAGTRGARFADMGGLAALTPQSDAAKKAYQKTKRQVAAAFKQLEPSGYKRGYSSRVLGSQGKRYKSSAKKAVGRYTKKGKFLPGEKMKVFGKERQVSFVDAAGAQRWDATRVSRRAAGEWGHTLPFTPKPGRYARGQGVKFTDVYEERGGRYVARGGMSASAPLSPEGMSLKQLRAAYPGITARSKSEFIAKLSAASNPFFGDLALTNPSFGGAGAYLGGYALPVMVAGAAAGGLTAWASSQGWTESLADVTSKIPAVGEMVADNLPYTLQGLLVGTGLAMLAPMIGGTAGKYLALTGGAALVFGGGIDAFNYMTGGEEDSGDAIADIDIEDEELAGLAFGDLALENVSALGDLALENFGDLALENRGMSFQGASLTSSDEYGQCGYGDAFYSGADFSGEEGQALLNGRHSFFQRFGTPPYRPSSVAGQAASHLAGRRGHRWGWLIRTVGWEKAQQICALPPKQRIKVIHQLRQAAIATYQQLVNDARAVQAETGSSDPEFVAVSGSAAAGADGANGATNYLGDPALFMGA